MKRKYILTMRFTITWHRSRENVICKSKLMNKKSPYFLKILTQLRIGLLIKYITTLQDSYLDLFSCIFLITWTTISRERRFAPFTALPTKRLARESTALLSSFTSTQHLPTCRCPCTMVHVISGEWSSPDAYTNSFNVSLPSFTTSPLRPRRIPFNIFLPFLRFSSDSVGGGRKETSGDSSLFHATVKATQKPWQKRTGAIL